MPLERVQARGLQVGDSGYSGEDLMRVEALEWDQDISTEGIETEATAEHPYLLATVKGHEEGQDPEELEQLFQGARIQDSDQ